MTTKQRPPLPAHAEKLWIRLQSNFLDMYKTLAEILEVEAWKPTYDTFTDAYNDKMHNITFAPELLPHIAYKMFDEGSTPEQVAGAVKGIGPKSAETIKRQKDNGVPAELVPTHIVRQHTRRSRAKTWVRFEIDSTLYHSWSEISIKNTTTINEVIFQAAAEAFDRLAKN
jgi:hypothetical protein